MAGQTLGGRFEVDGLYEGGALRQSTMAIKSFRMKQISPWFSDPQAPIGEAILSMDYRGAIGDKASALTGSGNVHLENAPLVKVPLLDTVITNATVLDATGIYKADVGIRDGRRGLCAAGLAVFGLAALAKDPLGALLPPLLSQLETQQLRQLYGREECFRSTVDMARYR